MSDFKLPPAVLAGLRAHDLSQSPVLLATQTDISLAGEPAAQWLVITKTEISVFTPEQSAGDGGSAQLLQSVPVKELEAVRTWAGLGSGTLQVKVAGRWRDLLRFSNAHADRFHKVSRKLDLLRSEGEWQLAEDERLDPHRCGSCGLRLAHTEETCPRCIHRSQVLARVWSLLRPQFSGAVMLCLLTIVGVVAELVPPKLQQYLVDDVLAPRIADESPQGQFFTALLVVVLALALSRLLLSIVGVFKGRLATQIGSNLTHRLRGDMVERLQKLAVAYYDRHQVGSLMSRVAYDSEVLHGLVHQLTGGFLLQILQLVGVGAMLVWLNPKLAFYTLIPVPLVFAGTWFFWQHVYPRYYRLWDSSSKQNAALSGMLSGIRVVKAFSQEDREYQRFQDASTYLRDSRLWVENATSVYSAAMQLVFSLGGLIVWYVGGRDVIGQEMSLGALIAFLAYLAMFYAPLGALSNFTSWLTSFLTGSKRVLELLDTPITVAEKAAPEAWPEVQGEIRFEGVTFGYDRHQPVLQNVSFDVRPGEMVGIVGRSGSGKTTLVNLLGRFYDVQEGAIRIDGHDIRSLSLADLRRNLGIVFQDSFMFRGTIWENLSYGRPQTTIEEGISAARAAGAHDFICRAALGYETPLGEQGAGLSGGEKQRLSIARTLLYDPRILVLDEATSNIDAEAERAIQQALEVLVKGRTTIAIAHRLSTLRNADRIIVFDRGRLVEQGSHAELLAADGVYARLVRIQTQVTKNPSVDKLTILQAEAQTDATAESDQSAKQTAATASVVCGTGDSVLAVPAVAEESAAVPEPVAHAIQWLNPLSDQLSSGPMGELLLIRTAPDGAGLATPQLAFVIACLPASHPERYLSLRGWDDKGDEVELGMLRDLAEWPAEAQAAVRRGLSRRYLLKRIERIHAIESAHGYLEFDVSTGTGREQFAMRWSQSQAQDFGQRGKILSDTEDNRFVVADVDALSRAERQKFLQFIYW
jgi:ATP-binding cassette subfamily B protein